MLYGKGEAVKSKGYAFLHVTLSFTVTLLLQSLVKSLQQYAAGEISIVAVSTASGN